MKKSERKAEIRKRAYEYAKNGVCNGWLSIEHKIAYVDAERVNENETPSSII